MNNGNTAVEGRATFQAGSSVKADDLNNNTKQVLRAIQELQDQKIQGYDLEDNSITTTQITNGTITNIDISASAAIAGTKINPAFGSQNITTSGTVDGRDVSADGTKLDGIEANATADQTATEIRTLVEAATDSNVFTDDDHSKLNAIEAGATADQTAAEIKTAYETNSNTNAFTDAEQSKLNAIEASATADQTASEIRALVESATDSNVFTDDDHSKLNNIEANATADQTAAEIRALVESATNSNVFTDADHTKLNAIDSNATDDQTPAEIRAAVESASDSNVFTDADHTKLDGIETGATADQTDAEIRAAVESANDSNVFTDADHTKLGNAVTLTDAQTLTNKTLTTPVINDLSGTAVVTSGTSTSDNKVYSAKRSDELYSTGASQAATSATAAANSATAAASSQSAAASSATAAASSATTATTQASTATTQAANALTHLNTFKGQYLGELSSDPVTDSLGNAVNEGDLYFNTVSKQIRVSNGITFQGISENSVDASRFATSSFSSLYTASAGSNSINLGGLAITGAVFSTENIAANRVSLAKGSGTFNLGGI
tara:strand:- start:218 stop:1882 length:1665 start_codon:yes stop_codon:yes gene_type:complete